MGGRSKLKLRTTSSEATATLKAFDFNERPRVEYLKLDHEWRQRQSRKRSALKFHDAALEKKERVETRRRWKRFGMVKQQSGPERGTTMQSKISVEIALREKFIPPEPIDFQTGHRIL